MNVQAQSSNTANATQVEHASLPPSLAEKNAKPLLKLRMSQQQAQRR